MTINSRKEYNSRMKIIDNFLTEEEHSRIYHFMLGSDFPWYINNIVKDLEDDLDGKEFSHLFYTENGINSGAWDLIVPIINKINPSQIFRIRAALMPHKNEQKENGWHVDFKFRCTTAIYYVNSNNGCTKFKDGTIVDSVANRFVYFDSQLEHTGTHATDSQFRCLINFNYF